MSDDKLPEGLEHLAGEISREDLQRLAQQGLLRPSRPAPNRPPTPDGSTSTLRRPPVPPRSDELPPPDPALLERDKPAEVAYTRFGELQQLRFDLDLPEEEEEEEPKHRFRLRDIPAYITIGSLSLALIAERTYNYVRRAKRDFDRLPVMVRTLYYLAAALLLLILVGFVVGTQLTDILDPKPDVPVLQDAVIAPYGVDGRALPPADYEPWQLLPETLGDFPRSPDVISATNTSSPTNQCLLGLGYASDVLDPPTCTRSYGMVGTASARYLSGRMKVDVAIARFSNPQKVHGTMIELLIHARKYGRLGNFSVASIVETDYFFSNVRGWRSFTWSHGLWVFSISTVKTEVLEQAVEAFPY